MRETAFKWGRRSFLALKIAKGCPLALLMQVHFREGKALGSEEGKWKEVDLHHEHRKCVEKMLYYV
jgi:hypothetical protein